EHRAEFSGADQRDANRLAGCKASVEEAMKVHERNPIDPLFRDASLGADPESRDEKAISRFSDVQ
ncbi:MAG TPA: hypothetical protein VGJ75_15685, partial [Dongiaceae bacterium]